MLVRPVGRKREPAERLRLGAMPSEERGNEVRFEQDKVEPLGDDRLDGHAATIGRQTYGGDQVSTWSVLRLSCRSRSPVGLVKQPGTNVSADNELALAA